MNHFTGETPCVQQEESQSTAETQAHLTALVPVPAVADPPGAPPWLFPLPPLPDLTLVQTSFVCWLSDFLALLLVLGDIYIALININYLLSQVNKNHFFIPYPLV